jgi:hypothetical protein
MRSIRLTALLVPCAAGALPSRSADSALVTTTTTAANARLGTMSSSESTRASTKRGHTFVKAVAGIVATLTWTTCGLASSPTCSQGCFAVNGSGLVVGDQASPAMTVLLSDSTIALGSQCTPTRIRNSHTRKATRVAAKWTTTCPRA